MSSHLRWQHPLAVTVAVGVGGAIGALARLALMHGGAEHLGQAATRLLLVNVVGCGLLALVLVFGEQRLSAWHHLWRPVLATGVLGGFTSTSAFAGLSLELGGLHGFLYAATSVWLGLGAFALAQRLAVKWFSQGTSAR